jgi:hypothetical protein
MLLIAATAQPTTFQKSPSMPYRVVRHRIQSQNTALRHFTRIRYYALHGKPPQRYPLHSGRAFKTFEAAQFQAFTLSKQGYYGWILRVQEVRQEDWPEDHWRIDHRRDDAIAWLAQF